MPFDSQSCVAHSRYFVPERGELKNLADDVEVNGHSVRAIHDELQSVFKNRAYVCTGAIHAFATDDYRIGVYPDMGTEAASDGLSRDLLQFIADQESTQSSFTSFLAVFAQDLDVPEQRFEDLLWRQLAQLSIRSDRHFEWDPTVERDPSNPKFSFSFGGHAFFIVGLHKNSSRPARRVRYPILAFNLHRQFEALRADGRFEAMKTAIRRRELTRTGSINPMLADHGEGLEAPQYSGRKVDRSWKCPFHV